MNRMEGDALYINLSGHGINKEKKGGKPIPLQYPVPPQPQERMPHDNGVEELSPDETLSPIESSGKRRPFFPEPRYINMPNTAEEQEPKMTEIRADENYENVSAPGKEEKPITLQQPDPSKSPQRMPSDNGMEDLSPQGMHTEYNKLSSTATSGMSLNSDTGYMTMKQKTEDLESESSGQSDYEECGVKTLKHGKLSEDHNLARQDITKKEKGIQTEKVWNPQKIPYWGWALLIIGVTILIGVVITIALLVSLLKE